MVRIPILIVLLLFFAGTCALAAMGPQRVANTVHNFSTSAFWMYKADEETQICIFCHTPHGGSLNGPLWNRALPSATEFTHYTTATLDNVTDGASRALSDESLLCMSCHDGAMAVNHVLRPSSGSADSPTMGGGQDHMIILPMGNAIGGRIGDILGENGVMGETRNLTDDHPISFSYDEVRTAYQSAGRGNQLHSAAEAAAAGVRFYGAGNRVECGSCHDPHVNYDSYNPEGNDPTADENYRPFLIMPNTGSAMCLACHNK